MRRDVIFFAIGVCVGLIVANVWLGARIPIASAQSAPIVAVQWQYDTNDPFVRTAPRIASISWAGAEGYTQVCVYKIESPRNTGGREVFYGCEPDAPGTLIAANAIRALVAPPIDGAFAPYAGDVFRADFRRADGSIVSVRSNALPLVYLARSILSPIFR